MTTQEAIREILTLSDGTLANLTGLRTYKALQGWSNNIIPVIEAADVSKCRTWVDVAKVIGLGRENNDANS